LKYVNDKKWEENFQKLLKFESLNQHTFPDRKEDKKLNGWCVSQRLIFKRGKLEKEREEKLNSLMTWVWDSKE
tara:strand:+ start:94 stop:312 length:219 start_codon:yes stop_codon:yes gene_type:complete